jgi:hypothetical protein
VPTPNRERGTERREHRRDEPGFQARAPLPHSARCARCGFRLRRATHRPPTSADRRAKASAASCPRRESRSPLR